jgi:Coiled-coil and interaction region of P66A and P66B with MBD2
LRRLREDLRNEETKLVLLKKLKQSQQLLKDNLSITPTNMLPAGLPPIPLVSGSSEFSSISHIFELNQFLIIH